MMNKDAILHANCKGKNHFTASPVITLTGRGRSLYFLWYRKIIREIIFIP